MIMNWSSRMHWIVPFSTFGSGPNMLGIVKFAEKKQLPSCTALEIADELAK